MKKQYNTKYISTLFASVYIFVALFSQNFHNHSSSLVFKDFHFKKTEKTCTKKQFSPNFENCLSCHFLYDGNTLIPNKFGFTGDQFTFYKQDIFAYKLRFSTFKRLCFQLRGPPEKFI